MAIVVARKKSGRPAAEDTREVDVYSRVSKVDDEQSASLKTQEAGGIARAVDKHGVPRALIRTFRENFTGEELWYRPVLSEIRDRIRQGKVRLLVVYSIDRLARDPVDQAIVIKECKRYDCEVDFVTEDFDDSMEGELIRFAKGYAAKLEIRLIKDRTSRGRMDVLRSGQLLQAGYAAFGYRYTDLHLPPKMRGRRAREVDAAAAEIVIRLFHWIVVDGYGCHTIALMLNVEGIPAPKAWRGFRSKSGREPIWHASSVRRIVANPIYCGGHEEKYGATQCVGIRPNGRPLQVPRPEAEQMAFQLVEATPSLVSRDLWVRANYRIKNNELGARRRNGRVPRLLRGLIHCNVCGHPMYPSVAMSDGKKHHYYQCGSPRTRTLDGQRCGGRAVPAGWVEERIWQEARALYHDRDRLRDGFARMREEARDPQLESDLASLEEEIAKQERLRLVASKRWAEATAEGDDDQAAIFAQHMKLAGQKIANFRERASTIRGRMASMEDRRKAALDFEATLDRAAAVFEADDATFDQRRATLEALGARVVGDGRWAKVTFFVQPEPSPSITDNLDELGVVDVTLFAGRLEEVCHS